MKERVLVLPGLQVKKTSVVVQGKFMRLTNTTTTPHLKVHNTLHDEIEN